MPHATHAKKHELSAKDAELRDQIAVAALSGLAAMHGSPESAAEMAYKYADAMMKARTPHAETPPAETEPIEETK
jgi:hypothetical protein